MEVHVAGHIDQLNRKTEESNATNAVEVHVAGHIDYINRKTEESNATQPTLWRCVLRGTSIA